MIVVLSKYARALEKTFTPKSLANLIHTHRVI